ncbi:hypothetical protein BJ875DRAFT_438958 [Amylocarpus encephaloides]|uniref:Uncharacterized protein n=1 Tax=Amylocarpus encephaloides TaxID=45428 RepID=A0A9P7YN42_9HELO|nr:hypothetical protein BJ875DRAFT_438958 [Amylocarpus encephaloides]
MDLLDVEISELEAFIKDRPLACARVKYLEPISGDTIGCWPHVEEDDLPLANERFRFFAETLSPEELEVAFVVSEDQLEKMVSASGSFTKTTATGQFNVLKSFSIRLEVEPNSYLQFNTDQQIKAYMLQRPFTRRVYAEAQRTHDARH